MDWQNMTLPLSFFWGGDILKFTQDGPHAIKSDCGFAKIEFAIVNGQIAYLLYLDTFGDGFSSHHHAQYNDLDKVFEYIKLYKII
ncbi:hypothetical protein ABFY41_13105 [Acinetobacter haemolyticus]|uniref:hypothetical protein n=1 Tax=Acinetobacter TaxID=469 RepID=UPI0030F3979B